MRVLHLVHGILTPVGKSGLLELVPYLRAAGFDVRNPDYGLITACETKLANPLIWRTLLPYIEPGDLYVGHSNGCAIGYDLVTAGAPLAGLVLIDAALERSITLPAGMWADCYFNEGDTATEAAVVAADLGLSDPVWGEMGHAGYDGANPLISNVDCGHPPAALPIVSGHGDVFTPAKLAAWAPYIVERITSRLAQPRAAA